MARTVPCSCITPPWYWPPAHANCCCRSPAGPCPASPAPARRRRWPNRAGRWPARAWSSPAAARCCWPVRPRCNGMAHGCSVFTNRPLQPHCGSLRCSCGAGRARWRRRWRCACNCARWPIAPAASWLPRTATRNCARSTSKALPVAPVSPAITWRWAMAWCRTPSLHSCSAAGWTHAARINRCRWMRCCAPACPRCSRRAKPAASAGAIARWSKVRWPGIWLPTHRTPRCGCSRGGVPRVRLPD